MIKDETLKKLCFYFSERQGSVSAIASYLKPGTERYKCFKELSVKYEHAIDAIIEFRRVQREFERDMASKANWPTNEVEE